MSNYLNVAPNCYPGRLAEHISATYADSEAAWYYPDHQPFAASTHSLPSPYHTCAPKQDWSLQVSSLSSGINSLLSLPTRKSRHTHHQDPDHVPRPRNAFIFFCSAYITSVCASAKDQQNKLSKHAGALWNAMSPEEKRPFCELAAIEKEKHYAMYPDYVYSPGVKASPKPSNTRKVNGESKIQEKQRKMPMASVNKIIKLSTTTFAEHLSAFNDFLYPAHASGTSVNLDLQAVSSNTNEKIPMGDREPPPFHPHLDHVTGQFGYEQYTHDFMYTSVPTLLRASSPYKNSNSMPPVPAHDLPAYLYGPAPSSLLCDNLYPSADYLAIVSNSSFVKDDVEGDSLLQQYTDESTRHSEITTQSTEYYVGSPGYQDRDASALSFFDFSMSAYC